MKRVLVPAAMAVLLGSASLAHATTLNFGSLTLGIASTGATCTPFPALAAPVAANTALCTITVTPSGWTGVVSNPTGGADSSKFAVVGVGGVPTLENTVQLTATGSAAGNNVYAIGSSTVTP